MLAFRFIFSENSYRKHQKMNHHLRSTDYKESLRPILEGTFIFDNNACFIHSSTLSDGLISHSEFLEKGCVFFKEKVTNNNTFPSVTFCLLRDNIIAIIK